MASAAATTASAIRWTARGRFTVAFLGIAAGVQMADRGLQAILLGAIQASFRVDDAMIGAFQGLAGVLIGSALAVPIGRIGDRSSRKRLLLALVAVWAVLMAASALAPTFALFFACRAALGVTEFAMIPVAYSLIPDLAPERERVATNLAFAALMAAGSSAGFYFGSAILAAATAWIPGGIEPWRKAMLLLAAAGLPLLIAGTATIEPARSVRGEADAALDLPGFLRERRRAVGLFVGVAGLLLVAVQALGPLAALALERRYRPDLAMLGHALGIITLAATLGCLPLAGLIDRTLAPRYGVAARPLVMGVGAFFALPCAALLAGAASLDRALGLIALFMFTTSTSNALVPTMLQDLTPASLRARSFALWSYVVSIFCALGPLAAGLVSDHLLNGHLLSAIAVVACLSLVGSILCAIVASRSAYLA